MSTDRQALVAELEELEHRQYFYASAIGQAEGIHRVYELARTKDLPSLKLASKVAARVSSSPPKKDEVLSKYLNNVVLLGLPMKTQYDDVFWCCLLHILDENDVPDCDIGGPLHQVIYQVYDDFDPEDVLG